MYVSIHTVIHVVIFSSKLLMIVLYFDRKKYVYHIVYNMIKKLIELFKY